MAQVGRGVSSKWVKPKLFILVLFGIAAVALAIGLAWRGSSGGVTLKRTAVTDATEDTAAALPQTAQAETTSTIYVHVDGAVNAPGVYLLEGDDVRANDAVGAAGGLAEDADTSVLNLAALLADGDKLLIPRKGESVSSDGAAVLSGENSAGAVQGSGAVSSASGSQGSGAGSTFSAQGLLNINTATADQLDALPGVGPSTAAAIVEDRTTNGPFASVEDLMRVSGIGEKKFAKLRGQICV